MDKRRPLRAQLHEVIPGQAVILRDREGNQCLGYVLTVDAKRITARAELGTWIDSEPVNVVSESAQLDQVLQGTHPGGSELSVLRHLMGGAATIPPDRARYQNAVGLVPPTDWLKPGSHDVSANAALAVPTATANRVISATGKGITGSVESNTSRFEILLDISTPSR